MPRFSALLLSLVVVVPLLAQSEDPPDFGVLVEFRDPPLAELSAGHDVRAAMVDYQSTFTRFRQDLTSILNAGMAAKTAAAFEPPIGYEYQRRLGRVMFGLLAGKRLEGWTAVFLASTVATSEV